MDNYKDLIESVKNNSCINTSCDRVGLVRQVLLNLNRPDQFYRIIHVVGTHGKRDFVKVLDRLMEQSGLKIACLIGGLSSDPRSQIKINGQSISEEDYIHNFLQIYCHLPLEMTENELTQAEWTFLIGLNYFAEKNVDWLILPAVMGGIGDTSNAIGAPDLVVVTSCCMDHWRKLGSTIHQVAQAKAGVVKPGTKAVIVGPGIQGEFHEEIAAIVRSKGVRVIESKQFVTLSLNKEGSLPAFLQVRTPQQHFNLTLPGKLSKRKLRNLYLILTTVNWLKENGLTVKTSCKALVD